MWNHAYCCLRQSCLLICWAWAAQGALLCGQVVLSEANFGEASSTAALVTRSDELIGALVSGNETMESLWSVAEVCLLEWEASIDLKLAGKSYLAILRAFADGARIRDGHPREAAFRVFLEKALKISTTAEERGILKLAIAESLLREPDTSVAGSRRQVDFLLREAVLLLPERAPKDVLYRLLCRDLPAFPLSPEAALERQGLRLTEAAQYLRSLIEVEGARKEAIDSARDLLESIEKEELSTSAAGRFMPFEAVRLPIHARNLDSAEVRVYALPSMGEEAPYAMEDLNSLPLENAAPLVRETVVFNPVERNDWQERSVQIGEGLAAGWYAIEVISDSLTRRDLLLVTDLEIIARAIPDGLEVRIFSLRTGRPVPDTEIFLIQDSLVIESQVSDGLGACFFPEIGSSDGMELVVATQDLFGALPIAAKPVAAASAEVEFKAYPQILKPGESLRWLATGDVGDGYMEFELPDQSIVGASADYLGESWASGELKLPPDILLNGGVYRVRQDGARQLVAHIWQALDSSLQILPISEPLYAGTAVFLKSQFEGIEISVMDALSDLPEYIRVEICGVERLAQAQADEVKHKQVSREVLVRQLNANEAVRILSNDLRMGADLGVFQVTVFPLEGDEVLGTYWFSLSADREIFFAKTEEQLIRSGESVEILIQRPWEDREIEGNWIVYKETWRSRYVHRKRGTYLSESEYMALPERSLLGAAKTDFELFEEGFVREEIERLPAAISGHEDVISINFSLPGYYKIEFNAASDEVRALYPDGPMEVWVIGDGPDLKTFRSDEPRLIIERNGENQAEVLLLSDRSGLAAVLEWEADIRQERYFEESEASAIFAEISLSSRDAPVPVEAALIGERFSKRLRAVLPGTYQGPDWKLEAQALIGLSPGAPIQWKLNIDEENIPLWWTFVEGSLFSHGSLSPPLDDTSSVSNLFSMLELFPLAATLQGEAQSEVGSEVSTASGLTPHQLKTLYPELFFVRSPDFLLPQILDQQTPYPEPRTLIGHLPEQPGSWELVVYGVHDGRLAERRWALSTDLPVDFSIDAPGYLRQGDRFDLQIRLRNSLAETLFLDFAALIPEGMSVEDNIPSMLQLPALREVSMDFSITANVMGPQKVAFRMGSEDRDIEVAATRSIGVIPVPEFEPWRIRLLAPNELSENELEVDLSQAGASVRLLAGLGSALPNLWQGLASGIRPADQLMGALGDWSLASVMFRYGRPFSAASEFATAELDQLLTAHAVEGGGWSFLPQGSSSLWLSAQIVAILEMGAEDPESMLQGHLLAGRAYLEKQLLEQPDTQPRLEALHALSISSAMEHRRGPTRFEARSFLEMMQNRETLTPEQVALLLLIARNFAFEEEVRLLGGLLEQQLREQNALSSLSLSSLGQVYLALSMGMQQPAKADPVLHEMCVRLSESVGLTGWQQLAAFLALIMDDYWQGDFDIGGNYAFAVGADSLEQVDLTGFASNKALQMPIAEPTEGIEEAISLTVDTRDLSTPLYLFESGGQAQKKVLLLDSANEVRIIRIYEQQTLLMGSIERRAALTANRLQVQANDLLVLDMELENLVPGTPMELEVPIPGGLALMKDSVELWNADSAMPNTLMELVEGAQSLWVGFTAPGDGKVVLRARFAAKWTGTFSWPAAQLFDRMEGTCYQVGDDRELTVLPAKSP